MLSQFQKTRYINQSKITKNKRITTKRNVGKVVVLGDEARAKLLSGALKIAQAVSTTLGPKGRNVVIAQDFGEPKITKDGVTVAKAIEFSDPFEEVGARLVRSVAKKTNDEAGDGTTTASVLARAIFEEGCHKVTGGMNPMDLWKGISKAVDVVVEELNNLKFDVEEDQIRQVATVSANNDVKIGELIARALKEVGRDGVITVETGKGIEDKITVVKGMKFNEGFLSSAFVTNPTKFTSEYEDAYVLITDYKIEDFVSLVPLLEQVNSKQVPLVLICAEGLESSVLTMLVVNKRSMKLNAVKAPGFGDNRKGILEDLAILTGGSVIRKDEGMKLEEVNLSHLGRAKHITSDKDNTLVVGGEGDPADIAQRVEELKNMIKLSTSDYEKEKLKERVARLSAGVGVLEVGGTSEVEVSEKKR
jgi:chaperonin GroEL